MAATCFTEIEQHPISEKVGVFHGLSILVDQLEGAADGHFAYLLFALTLLALYLLSLQLPHEKQQRAAEYERDNN
jgi:hypothetical protein